MTIIITTHYIEEARRANTVGFMRKGHLLVQDSPDTILQSFGISSLEMAFLHICSKDMDDVERDRKRSGLSATTSSQPLQQQQRSSSRSDAVAAAGDSVRRKSGFSDNHVANDWSQLSCTVEQNLYSAATPPPPPQRQLSSEQISSSPQARPPQGQQLPPLLRPQSLDHKSSDPIKIQSCLSQQHKYKQSFRIQVNIVRTLVMKGVIKMKRSIP